MRWMVVLMASAAAWFTGAATAQVADTDSMLARELQRLALIDLRLVANPGEADFRAAGIVLDMARQWAPDDLELLRRRIEVAQAAGETEVIDALTDRLLKLDPKDTTAQLRAIASRLRSKQTLGDRLAQYQKLIEAGSIDPSVRSRLALDAALLHRERGDDAGFARDLARAMKLDATNKEAAMLAWTRYAAGLDDEQRFRLLTNLLYADPLDAAVHRLIALELLAAGSFDRASRFHRNAVALTRDAFNNQVPEWLMNESLVLDWYIQGPEVVLEQLNIDLLRRRQIAAAQIQNAEAQGLPTAGLLKPEEVRLTPTFARERIVAAWLLGDDRTRMSAAADLRKDIEDWTEELQDPRNRPAGVDPREIARQVALETAEVWAFAAWADSSPQLIEVQLDTLGGRVGTDHASYKRLAAYRQAKLGNLDAAIMQIEALLEYGYVIDEAALAMVKERTGQIDEAAALYRGIVERVPLRAVGAWARQRLMGLDKPDVFASAQRPSIEQLADQVPIWIDRMIRDSSRIMRFRADVVDTGPLDPLAPAAVRLRIENISNIPLGVGDGRTIGGTVMLTPKLLIGMHEEFLQAQPEIVMLNHRLRLMPGEAIEVEVSPDAGLAGWTIAAGADTTVRADWRALHGFAVGATDGIARKSVTGLESGTGSITWSLMAETTEPFADLVDRLEAAPPSELPNLFGAIRAMLVTHATSPKAGVTTEQIERLAAILAQRLESLPQRERLLAIAMIPPARFSPGLEAFDRAALASTDSAVAALAILTRVTGMDNPVVGAWADREDPSEGQRLSRALLEARVLGRAGGLAQAGPDFSTLAPRRSLLLAPSP